VKTQPKDGKGENCSNYIVVPATKWFVSARNNNNPKRLRSLKLGTVVRKQTSTSRSSAHRLMLISVALLFLNTTMPIILYIVFVVGKSKVVALELHLRGSFEHVVESTVIVRGGTHQVR